MATRGPGHARPIWTVRSSRGTNSEDTRSWFSCDRWTEGRPKAYGKLLLVAKYVSIRDGDMKVSKSPACAETNQDKAVSKRQEKLQNRAG
jgi:hypothetical protein